MDHNSYYFDSQYQCDNENVHETENQNYYDSQDENFQEIDENELDGDALLISLVRNYPYLYNKELSDFKDIAKKQNAWTEIGNILDTTGMYIHTIFLKT